MEKFSGNGSTLQQLEFSLQISKPASSSVSAKSSLEVPILILLIFPGGLKLNYETLNQNALNWLKVE